MVIDVLPSELVEVIESMPAMVDNCCSIGVATADAMVSGVAPGRLALTTIVGKSMFGRSLTGSSRYAITPKTHSAPVSSVVITGRRIQRAGRFMAQARECSRSGTTSHRTGRLVRPRSPARKRRDHWMTQANASRSRGGLHYLRFDSSGSL